MLVIETNDTPPVMADLPTDDYEYSCEVCGKELFYVGRGRKPKFCEDHRKSKSANSSAPTRRKSSSIDSLIDSIEGAYGMAGAALSFYPPTGQDGMVITEGSRKLAESWRPLIERDDKIRKMWEKFFTVSGYGGLVAAHLFIVLPILQNHNIIPKPKGYTPPTVDNYPMSEEYNVSSSPFGTAPIFDEMGES